MSVIRDVALLKLVGFRPIIVHGGGKEITKWIGKIGLETRFVNGLRVTDEPTMEVAEMVLNRVNKGLVSMMEQVGLKAVGISGKDGTVLRVERKLFRRRGHWICGRGQGSKSAAAEYSAG